MPAVSRQGDACTGHDSWVPRGSSGGSGDVYVNGIPCHREGDGWPEHESPTPDSEPHPGTTAGGSGTVYANGQPVARIGDPVDCGSAIAAGSGDVFAGG